MFESFYSPNETKSLQLNLGILWIEWIDIQIYFFLSIFINKISCPSIKSQLNNYVSYGNLADTCSNVKFHDMSPTHIDFDNHLNSIHLGGVNINLIYIHNNFELFAEYRQLNTYYNHEMNENTLFSFESDALKVYFTPAHHK